MRLSIAVLAVVIASSVWVAIKDWADAAHCRRLQAIYLDEYQRIAARVYAIRNEGTPSQKRRQKIQRYRKQDRALERELESKGCPLPVGED